MTYDELQELTDLCQEQGVKWHGSGPVNITLPITVYYDDPAHTGKSYLNYSHGDEYLHDWGVPIIMFSDLTNGSVSECQNFLDLL